MKSGGLASLHSLPIPGPDTDRCHGCPKSRSIPQHFQNIHKQGSMLKCRPYNFNPTPNTKKLVWSPAYFFYFFFNECTVHSTSLIYKGIQCAAKEHAYMYM